MSKQNKMILIGWILLIPLAVTIIIVLLQNMGVLEAHAAPVEDFTVEEVETVNEAELSAMPCVDPEPLRQFLETYEETETETIPIYRIAGDLIDPEIQMLLYEALDAEGISYWYEGALAQMFQESHGYQYAENRNGLDKGLFQYRITYWNWDDGDIFDPEAQIRLYSQQMSKRFNSGLTADEAISRHNTSDYVSTINQKYVSDVKQWLYQMEVVE